MGEGQKDKQNIIVSSISGRLILDSKDHDGDKTIIKWLISEIANTAELAETARAYKRLWRATQKTLEEIEDYLLMHHIQGRCRLCKKLAGY